LGAKEKKMIYATGGSQKTKNIDTNKEERSRFVLTNEEILKLARWAAAIETHYGKPMDIEWAKDGETGDLFIVQARPETVQSQKRPIRSKRIPSRKRGENSDRPQHRTGDRRRERSSGS
jgi:pyruvate, water dikinase